MPSPDLNASGLTKVVPEVLRYDGQPDDPYEVAGMLRMMMPSNARVLDVGCGTGSVTLIANLAKNNSVKAIEPDEIRAATAASRGLTVHCGLLDEEYIQAHGPFDVVMSSDVLEHMAAPAEALGLFALALAPAGKILVSVPNVAHWSVRANLLFGRFEYQDTGIMDATHLRWFTATSIVKLVEACGFEVLRLRQTAGVDLPVYTSRFLRRLPRRLLDPTVRALSRIFPRLFGAQHVLIAQLRNGP